MRAVEKHGRAGLALADDYPLEQLSPRAFEQLTVALALETLGPGVQAFGAGADGGREATYRGRVNWSATTGFGDESWDGYVVIQAKQKAFPDANPGRNAGWLRGQIEKELDDWEWNDSRRGDFPKYIIFVTNVRISSVANVGGIDSINNYMKTRYNDSLKKRGLRGWKIWHRDQLNGFLSINEGIRNAFPAMLTVGDVISRFNALSTYLPNTERLHEVLVDHAQSALLNEQWVNFSEAGGESRDSIQNVIIDLPVVKDDDLKGFALKTILGQGERVLRPSLIGASEPRHIVLTGAPGNGKSTLSKFITQTYRSAFVSMDTLMPSAAKVVQGTTEAEKRLALGTLLNKRWPFRVNLAEYADALGPDGDIGLLRWISQKITQRGTANIAPNLLESWLRVWPWMLVLDGLDEVTMPEVRRKVLDEITLFVETADALNSDLLVVVTTRPTGYTERVAPEYFYQIDLGYLEPSKALEYGTRAIRRRLSSDFERQDVVLLSFTKAVRNSNAERLLKTPLQVLILTYILEKLGTLPADRYELFWRYYLTVYDREAAKITSLSSLFSRHKSDITELHERVALELQIQAETLGEAKSTMPLGTLRKMAVDRMREIGHDGPGVAERIADQIVNAATHRLVLFVPEENDTVTFEVRSLQELMAARAMGSGSDEDVDKRLMITGPSPHWRNTWVFVAGRIFSEGSDHQRNRIAEVVARIDEWSSLPTWLCPVAPELAAEILDDGLAATKPRWQRKFADVALRTLVGAIPRNIVGMQNGLAAAAQDDTLRIYIRNCLKNALASAPKSVAVVRMIVASGNLNGASPVDPGPHPDYASMLSGKADIAKKPSLNFGDLLSDGLEELGGSEDTLTLAALEELRKMPFADLGADGIALLPLKSPIDIGILLRAFENDEAATTLELLCGTLKPTQWQAQAALAQLIWPAFTRKPVGEEIMETFRHH